MFVLIAAEALLILLTAPLGVQVRAHFCLNRKCAFAQITVAGITVAKIKLETKKGRIRISVNGKNPLKKKSVGLRFGDLRSAFEKINSQGLVKRTSLSLAVGGEDCFGGAMETGVLGAACLVFLPRTVVPNVYWDREKQRLDVEVVLGMRVSVLQTLSVATTALKNSRKN